MQPGSVMRTLTSILIATSLLGGCAVSTTYPVDEPAGSSAYYGLTGTVESVRPLVRRVEGDPASGAVAGALIGGILFGAAGGRALFGAAAGAATGAAVSSGSYETRVFEITVRFDDGSRGVFSYRDYPPFRPGDRVQLGSNGPMLRRGY
jgi:outer membrane lipoprotein SlyB